ncbi:MAG: adenylyl-sulfate reductase subunit alpha [Synergistaceae bacterium]|jgi:adenylylsulfate reductase subunit A|nr:adenylyl-sulfate reductase subunit alpha [Synergistaceae bacterium]
MAKSLREIRFGCDVLIIGGGTAGCQAALTLGEHPSVSVIVAEKANIKRSGCLAAGVNALNAYIVPGRTPEDYAEYARNDAAGIARDDLLLSAARGFNRAAERLESLGLVILKNRDGSYAARGNRNIRINGENIKPILAGAVSKLENVRVLNRVNIVDCVADGENVFGAVGLGVDEEILYVFEARAVICATGGASGLYRPNSPGFSRHRMWYPPFNTGAGYAMGIRAGAEMTTLEMRFIALRCRDTIAPTGTIAQGVGARQVNSLGEYYEERYGLSTWERLRGAVEESRQGRGPCYLRTRGITPDQEDQLYRAYLNMAPAQTLKWLESGSGPHESDVEIEGTEPYIVGGHTASGYWTDTGRRATLRGLYAAGDVSGGCPQKYVTGAMAEGEIAALSALRQVEGDLTPRASRDVLGSFVENLRFNVESWLGRDRAIFTADDIEEAMQTAMDRGAGGISSGYRYNNAQLAQAGERIEALESLAGDLRAADMREAVRICELKERLLLCRSVIAHLGARKETRWGPFADHADYPKRDDENYLKFVNSRMINGKIEIIYRDIARGREVCEHSNRP